MGHPVVALVLADRLVHRPQHRDVCGTVANRSSRAAKRIAQRGWVGEAGMGPVAFLVGSSHQSAGHRRKSNHATVREQQRPRCQQDRWPSKTAVSDDATAWLLLVRRSHDVGAEPDDNRFPNRTTGATNRYDKRATAFQS